MTALTGCTSSGSATTAAPDEVVDDVVVQLDGDRPPVVRVFPISMRERDAQLAARMQHVGNGEFGALQQAITVDGGCSSTSLWIYTGYDFTGLRLCFSGAGTAQLRDYSTFVDQVPHTDSGTYMAGVRSYWAGSETGGFWGPSEAPGSLFCGTGFGAYQAVRDPDACVKAGRQVYLSN
jgi:hypothetical protein